MKIPEDMWPGTTGVGALLVNSFLNVWATDNVEDTEGFIVDLVYGEKAAALMKAYQKWNDLEEDGGVGPKTRAQLKDGGFDFEALLEQLPGTTVFVVKGGLKEAYTRREGETQVAPETSVGTVRAGEPL